MPYFLQIQQQQQSNLKIRLFITIVAEDDDLVSPESTLSVNHYVSSREKITRVYCGDHIGLCVSSIAHKKLWPEVLEWILFQNQQ
jgi:poly(3-hydroxyalkanoate) synthetase